VAVGLLGTVAWAGGAWAAEPAEVFRFGTAEIGASLTNVFGLRNDGAEKLEIQDATPSCECLRVVRWPAFVEAGGTGEVEVVFAPDHAGTVDYRIDVRPKSPDRPGIELAIQGEVVAAARAPVERDWTLYLGTDEVAAALRDSGGVVWVDVRSAEAYEKAHVPGALQMASFVIKTKNFLKSRRAVLVDEGWGSRSLEAECRKLRDMGFADLWIWYGGLNAWRQLGGPLEGAEDDGLDRVPAVALREIAEASDWLVVSAGGGIHGVAGAVEIPFVPSAEADFAAALGAALAERPEVTSVLISTEQGYDYDRLVKALAGTDVFAFYLEGGWAAWESHRKLTDALPQRKAVVSRSETVGAPPRRGGGCGGCPH